MKAKLLVLVSVLLISVVAMLGQDKSAPVFMQPQPPQITLEYLQGIVGSQAIDIKQLADYAKSLDKANQDLQKKVTELQSELDKYEKKSPAPTPPEKSGGR